MNISLYIRMFIGLLFIGVSQLASAQIQVAKILDGEEVLRTRPRMSVDFGIPFNLMGPYALLNDPATFLESGLFLTNNGYVYEDSEFRYVHRTLGLAVPIRAGKIVKEHFYLGVGHSFNFPFHYKLKTYDAGTRSNKQKVVSEFFSDRTTKFYPAMELSAGISSHGIGRFSIRLQMFYMDFFNPAFSETVDGVEVFPFQNFTTEYQLKISLSYNPGL